MEIKQQAVLKQGGGVIVCNAPIVINIEDIATLFTTDIYILNQNTTINVCEKLILNNITLVVQLEVQFTNIGIIEITGTGILSIGITGTINNEGVINNNNSGNSGISNSNIFNNTGVINLAINSGLLNPIGFFNNSGGTINNSGTIDNGSLFYNPQNQLGCLNGIITGTGMTFGAIPLTTCAPG